MKHLKTIFACLLMAVLSIGQVWADEGDVVVAINPCTIAGSSTSYNTYSNANWAVNVCNNSAFGVNTTASNGAKQKLSNNSAVSDRNTAIASALAAYTEAEFTVNTQYVAALIGLSDLANVGKFGVTYGGTNGGKPDDVWVLASTNSGTSYSVVGHSNSISSGLEIEFATIASAQYAVVFQRSAQFGLKSTPVLTFYEGATAGGATLVSIAISGTPTKTDYVAGEEFDATGLVAMGTYSDDSEVNISSSVEWSYTPAGALTQGLTSVNVTATKGEIASAATPIAITVASAPVIVSSVEGIEDGGTYYIKGVRSSGSIVEYLTFTDGTAGASISGGSASSTEDAVAITFNKVSDGVYQLVTPEGLYVQPGASNGKIALSTSATTCNIANTTKTWDNSAAIAISTVDGSSKTWIIQKNTSGTNFGGYKNSGYDVTLIPATAPAVNKPTISGDENFLTSTTVTLSCTTDGATIYYTTDGSDPKSSATTGTSFTLTNSATVRAIAKKGDDWSAEATKSFTKATVLTPAEALAIINGWSSNKTSTEDYYVAGIISQIDEVNENSFATYYISADGTTTDQLQVYKGLWVNGANFTSTDQIQLGDEVTVKGKLKKYNSYKELDQNNKVVLYLLKARLSWSGALVNNEFAASLEGANTFPTLVNSNSVAVEYSSSNTDAATINASTGAITLKAVGSTTITASFAGNPSFKANSVSYTLNVSSSVIKADISFEENGGSAVADLTEQSNLPNPLPAITKAGKNFGGWWTTETFEVGTEAVAGAAVASTDPITLYAKWLDPYTVTEALAIIDALEDGQTTTEFYYVAGEVTSDAVTLETGSSATYKIKDAGEENSLTIYKGKGKKTNEAPSGEDITEASYLQESDAVILYGQLQKYVKSAVTTPEVKSSYIYSLNRPEIAVTGVTLESTASVAVGKTINLSASVLPANATNKTINWSVQSGSEYASVADGVVTGIAEGTAVVRATSAADATKYAECTVTVAPLSPWASVYTSNVTLAAGSNAQSSKVRFTAEGTQYDAVKAGTGKAGGSITVTVPAQATALHLHVVGWSGENPTVTITAPTGVTVTPASISATADAGLSSNSPFTLQNDPVDQYLALSLSGNTEEIELTFSTDAGNKRFALYGVNQEGAVVLESISITGEATALEYNDGDHFSPAGLGVTGHYSDASTAPITEGIVWAFDPDPLTEGTTSVSVTATAGGFTSAAFVVDGLTVAGAAPLSPWATTWTSNLDDITGSKVKFYGEETEYAALKAGSSGTAGSATLHIPAQATELHLHAYGWNSEDVTLSITAPAGVTVTPASITLNRNSGFASNSPFTLAEGSTPQTDAYYALSLSGNTDAIELTITATEGKRFLLFGVNQEGGQLPVLESIEIKGDLTTKTGYKAGDALNLDGLTVEATYSIGGVAQTPVDITDKLGDGLTLTYDPLVENQTEVTITATYGDKSDDITITGLDPVASADPKIYVSTLNVNFASVEVGESVPAAETVTVTLTNVASVTATLGGTNADAFSVSPASLTESGDITISILANTDAAASYSATLTISDGAEGAEDKTINLSFAVTEPVVTEEYQLVSDVTSLAAGDQIIIVAENEGDYYTLDGSISSQYFPSTTVSIAAGIITAPSTSAIILGKDGDNWTMSIGGQLIGATAAKKASLGNNDASNTWTIAIAENVATITNTTTTYGSLQFNYNNGSNSRFLNYTSTQTAVAIYKKVAAPEPEYETVRSGLEINRYYTVCLPKKVTAIKGASFWTLNNKSQDGATAYLEEETNNLPFAAGTPFIIQATAANLEVVYEGAATEDAGTNGALHGTLVYMDAAALAVAGSDIYMLFSNELRPVGENNHLDANRAYVKLNELNSVAEAPQSAPGKRVRAMPMQPQTATGIEDLNASEKPMKMMINGQIFILRGEKMYDTTGRLVK